MTKKEHSSSQYFLAAGLAAAIGLVYVTLMFHVLLGPGMLLVAAGMLLMGLKRQRAERAAPAPTP